MWKGKKEIFISILLIGLLFILLGTVAATEYGYNIFPDNSFLNLKDTPLSYAGQANKCVTVAGDESGLVFGACGAGGGGDFSFTDFQASFTLNFSALSITDFNSTNFADAFNSNFSFQSSYLNSTYLYSNGTGLDLDSNTFSLKPTTYYNVTNITVVAGQDVQGDLQEINAYDGNSYNITEVAASPGLDLRLNFTGVTDFNQVIFRYKNTAGENHIMNLQIYDYDSSDWENYGTASAVPSFTIFEFGVFDSTSHISGGVVQVRILTSSVGNPSHTHYFDWASLSLGLSTPAGMEVDPNAVYKDGSTELTNNWDVGNFNITNINLLQSKYINVSEYLNVGGVNVSQWLFNQSDLAFNFNQSDLKYNYNQTAPANDYTDSVNSSIISWVTTTFMKITSLVNVAWQNQTNTFTENQNFNANITLSNDSKIKDEGGTIQTYFENGALVVEG